MSAYPQAVTAQMVENLARGGAAVNVLARHVGARVVVADLGVAAPLAGHAGVVERRIAAGHAQHHEGAGDDAATRPLRAIAAGAALVEARRRTASAPGRWGSGTRPRPARSRPRSPAPIPRWSPAAAPGVADDVWVRKVEAVRRALAVNRPDPGDPLGVLAALGGFEIAGLVGVVLAGAARRVPVVLDGFIATAAGAGRRAARSRRARATCSPRTGAPSPGTCGCSRRSG